jgi:hypothetical protein
MFNPQNLWPRPDLIEKKLKKSTNQSFKNNSVKREIEKENKQKKNVDLC